MIEFIKSKLHYLPLIGIVSYVVLYTIADRFYAGGAEQFTFTGNLLCDMMGEESDKGFLNDARYIAITGHVLLSIGMITFFYLLPRIFSVSNLNTTLFQAIGMLSMITFIFLSTNRHDFFVTVTGSLGVLALIPLSLEYIKLDSFYQSGFSLLCIACSLIVFFSYETKMGLEYLPAFQKVVFGLDTIWVLWVCLQVRSQQKLAAIKV